jgi:ribonuclease J
VVIPEWLIRDLTIHTSGHADIDTLKKMVEAVNPKTIVPIHTFNSTEYKTLFSTPVLELKDGDTVKV